MLYGLLRGEGMVKNCKHTYRPYIKRGLQIRNKKRKKTDPTTPADGNAYSGESALFNGFRLCPTQQW